MFLSNLTPFKGECYICFILGKKWEEEQKKNQEEQKKIEEKKKQIQEEQKNQLQQPKNQLQGKNQLQIQIFLSSFFSSLTILI